MEKMKDQGRSSETKSSFILTYTVFAPVKVLFIGVITYSSFFLWLPVDLPYLGSPLGWLFLISCLCLLVMGCLVGYGKYNVSRLKGFVFLDSFNSVFKVAMCLACIGVLTRLVDRYYLRGASMDLNFMDNREALLDSSFGMVSIVAATTIAFCYIVGFLGVVGWVSGIFRKRMLVITFVIGIFPMIESLTVGARSTSLVVLGLVLMFSLMLELTKKYRWLPPALAMLVIFGILLSGLVFSLRAEMIGVDYYSSMYMSGYSLFVPVNSELSHWLMRSETGFFQSIVFSFVNLGQYYTHGVFEFLFLYENFDTYHSMGAQNFYVIAKFFAAIFQLGSVEDFMFGSQVRSGVYNTFFGPVFLDFGWVGLVVVLFFGLFVGKLANIVAVGAIGASPLLAYLTIVIFFSPVVSLVASAQGIYTIFSLVLFMIISTLFGFRVHAVPVADKNLDCDDLGSVIGSG
jgi:hypothetical protein